MFPSNGKLGTLHINERIDKNCCCFGIWNVKWVEPTCTLRSTGNGLRYCSPLPVHVYVYLIFLFPTTDSILLLLFLEMRNDNNYNFRILRPADIQKCRLKQWLHVIRTSIFLLPCKGFLLVFLSPSILWSMVPLYFLEILSYTCTHCSWKKDWNSSLPKNLLFHFL